MTIVLSSPFWLLSRGGFAHPKQLSFAAIHHAQIAIERGIYGVFRRDEQLFLLPKFGDFFIVGPYQPAAEDPRKAFGRGDEDTAEGTRVKFPKGLSASFWRGVFELDGKWFFLDSYRRRLLVREKLDGEWRLPRDLVLDLIRPPADDRGPPIWQEVASLRQRFAAALKANQDNPEIFSDVAILPQKWRASFGGSQLLVASRLPGFPLVTLQCRSQGAGYCQFHRQCFLSPKDSLAAVDTAGIAVSAARKQILIGDYKRHRILVYRLGSCFHLPHVTTIRLPKKIGPLTALHVDQDDRLWVTTKDPDPYRNASVYVWLPADW
jgi:hypothetical protein